MPSFIVIRQTVWPQYTKVTDRQKGEDRQDRQRSDSIERTVLQTIAQKHYYVNKRRKNNILATSINHRSTAHFPTFEPTPNVK